MWCKLAFANSIVAPCVVHSTAPPWASSAVAGVVYRFDPLLQTFHGRTPLWIAISSCSFHRAISPYILRLALR
jgi:hypothetical protein